REQKVEVSPIRESELVLTETDETFHRLIIVVKIRVGDQRIDSVHLQGNFPIDGNVSLHYGVTELPVVNWNSCIGQPQDSSFLRDRYRQRPYFGRPLHVLDKPVGPDRRGIRILRCPFQMRVDEPSPERLRASDVQSMNLRL